MTKKEAMTQEEALKLLRGGPDGVEEWNRWRKAGKDIPSLHGADLSGANLSRANLSDANFADADLSDANLTSVNLSGASLSRAKLTRIDLSDANLSRANLSGADLFRANLTIAKLYHTDLNGATLYYSVFAGVDLSSARGLGRMEHLGPSSVSTSTLVLSKGKIPEKFLRSCGLQAWEVLAAKLYDPDLTAEQVNDLQYKIFDLRTTGPLILGGVFISYSHANSKFVDKVRAKLIEKSVPVWLDRHDLVAGPIQKQIDRGLRLQDVVLLVLSKTSIKSDWVEHELRMARKKEKEEDRDVLCPVALDESWKAKMNDVLWGQLEKKNVLDFAKWKTKAFNPQFAKLLKGLKIYYAPKDQAGDQDTARAT